MSSKNKKTKKRKKSTKKTKKKVVKERKSSMIRTARNRDDRITSEARDCKAKPRGEAGCVATFPYTCNYDPKRHRKCFPNNEGANPFRERVIPFKLAPGLVINWSPSIMDLVELKMGLFLDSSNNKMYFRLLATSDVADDLTPAIKKKVNKFYTEKMAAEVQKRAQQHYGTIEIAKLYESAALDLGEFYKILAMGDKYTLTTKERDYLLRHNFANGLLSLKPPKKAETEANLPTVNGLSPLDNLLSY
jgi:hypothetical protein